MQAACNLLENVVELEKLESKDPLRRFSEKVAIQKTIVNERVRESSPVACSPES